MSLTGFVDQTQNFNNFNQIAAKALEKVGGMKYAGGPVTTSSRIAFDSSTKSQVNDWINYGKLTVSQPGVSEVLYAFNHLVSW